jgi:perosamine synthetase
MKKIFELSKEYGFKIIEDGSHAIGGKYKGSFIGSCKYSDITIFSFHPVKIITTGEGGMVVARNQDVFERALTLKNQSVSKTREYWHDGIGYNYRMTNICAAIGLAQLERAEEILAKKRAIASWYRRGLCDLPLVFQEEEKETVHSYWMVSILTESQFYRDRIRAQLKSAEIETRPIFYPAHVMPVFKGTEIFPIAEDISLRGINLPSFPDLSENQVDFVCNKIRLCF